MVGMVQPSGPGLVERMRKAGIRVTSPRRAVARVLEESREHLTVEEITERAKALDSSVHRATVYRTLGMLKGLGLVDELDLLHLRGDQHYYEARMGEEHAHVICTQCGRVLEISGSTMASVRSALAEETGFGLHYVRMEVGGYCPACQARRARTGGDRD